VFRPVISDDSRRPQKHPTFIRHFFNPNRAIELHAIHAVDLPIGEDTERDLTDQFIADTIDQIQQAAAILLLTPATKESVPTLLLTLLERLPDNSFFKKPVLLFATGGLPAQIAVLERALRHELVRLGATAIEARVHLDTGNWITVGDDQPRPPRAAEREVAHSIDLVLRGIRLEEHKEPTLEFAGVRAGSPSQPRYSFFMGGTASMPSD
jgi:NAD(P)H-dependent FMN reductase